MNKKHSWVLVSLLAGVLAIAATAPVAMRVELEPLRTVDGLTEVEVVIQVSPEDRGRLGSNVIVRIELDGGAVSSGSPMRALGLESDGTARFTVKWPPGEHDLRVGIEDPSREDTGIWVGTVRIPDLSPGQESRETVESAPDPAPETTQPQESEIAAAEPDSVQGAESVTAKEPTETPEAEAEADEAAIEEEPPSEPSSPELAEAAGAAAAAAAVVPDTPAPTTATEPEIEQADAATATAQPEPEVAAPPPAEEPPTVEPEPEMEQPSEPEGEPAAPAVEEEPVPVVVDEEPGQIDQPEATQSTGADEETESLAPAEPTEVEEELPIVEPLRGDPSPDAVAPEAEPTIEAPDPAPGNAPLSVEGAALVAGWEQAGADTREFSLVVMRGREPVPDIDKSLLRLRVGGSDVPIEKLGNAESAPLLLGLAVDVGSEEVDGWSGARGSLSSLVNRAGGGRGRVFVATAQGVGAWGAEPGPPESGQGSALGSNVARMVVASLEPFAGQRGRTFLIVLTDGRNEPSKAEWNVATEAAGAAGVPILVIALWDEGFSHRTRKNLKALTVESGGSLFLVQGGAQLDSAADRFGRLLDGSYALRFSSSSVPGDKPTPVVVTASDKKLTVSAPKSIR